MHESSTTAAAGYQPTPAQLALLAAFTDIATRPEAGTRDRDEPVRTPIERICERAAVPPQRFAHWMRDADFRDWWTDATATTLRDRASLVLRALTERAELGDLGAIKLWLPRFDRLDGGGGDHERLAWLRICGEFFD